MFPFELLSMPDRTVNSNQGFSNMDYLAVPRSNIAAELLWATTIPAAALSISGLPCVAKTDQGEQIKGWSGSSEYNSMFARKLPKPEKLGNYSWSQSCVAASSQDSSGNLQRACKILANNFFLAEIDRTWNKKRFLDGFPRLQCRIPLHFSSASSSTLQYLINVYPRLSLDTS